MFETVMELVRTREDVSRLADEIEALVVSTYKAESGEFERVLRSEVREVVASRIQEEIMRTRVDRREYLVKLKSEIEDLPSIRLSLSFWPTEVFLDKLSSWVKTRVGPKVVIDLEREGDLLGGAVVSFDGKYGDYSVKAALEAIGKKQQEGKSNE